MSSGSKTQTQTTTSAPPKYLQPYLEQGAASAANLYNAGGTPVIGPSDATLQSLDIARQRALAGSPVTSAAQNLATNTLQGGFMGSNPWLDAAFNKAAGAVTNQVQSNFARAGRNAGGIDAAGVAADKYNNLATSIYGGAYDAERNRMNQLIPFTGQLANQDYVDIGQLANVGTTQENYAQAQANQPGNALDAYLARLQGFPGGTITQQTPMQRNALSGALGGAMMGSALGPWGMLGGAVLGGLYG